MVSLGDIKAAHRRIKDLINNTPLLTSRTLNNQVNAQCYIKGENFQRIGAFKFRGACNAIMTLDDSLAKHGVATHSSGNHAQAVALSAKLRGIKAHVVMPVNA
ncbi:MAG: pyridoxal-phosphate dependent enzyme, partial [Spirochaetes bacterium]|nr:pyridoxal-phosphate dependent enzyme [Spirochaetota bacterium]